MAGVFGVRSKRINSHRRLIKVSKSIRKNQNRWSLVFRKTLRLLPLLKPMGIVAFGVNTGGKPIGLPNCPLPNEIIPRMKSRWNAAAVDSE